MFNKTDIFILVTSFYFYLLLDAGVCLNNAFGRCDTRHNIHPDSVACPKKSCSQHIDCWVTYGPPQRCVCDPILCGSVCLPESAKCPEPAPLLNGYTLFNDTDVGDIVEYTCKSGFTVRGQRKRHCLATLKWSGTQPTCSNQTETCFSPPAILNTRIIFKTQNGTEKIRDDFRSGETVKIECIPGYKDADREYTEASCIGIDWHYSELKCERVTCGFINEPNNGYIQYKYDQSFQAEATISCSEGYKVVCDTEDIVGCKRVCLENGTWSGKEALCKAITCPEPQLILNGKIAVSSLKVNGTVVSECDSGYELHGSFRRICQTNGRWSGQEPYCKKRDCGPPPQIQNGEVSFITTTYGSKGTVTCEVDTTLSTEDNEIICGVNGTTTMWNPHPFPQCYRHCYLFTVEHGDVYLIHRGPKGDVQLIQITTAETGIIDDTQKQSVNTISDGKILPGGKVRHGSELNVTCQTGFALVKSNQPITVCQNGVWSVRSKCVPAPCRRQPPVYTGARARFYSLKHNSIARYEPFPGYLMRSDLEDTNQLDKMKTNGDPKGVLRCLYGEWFGVPLKFEPMQCSHISIQEPLKMKTITDGKLLEANTSTSSFKQGAVLIFSCPEEYYLDGPKYITCHVGQWTPKPISSCKQSPPISTIQRWLFALI
ncbi:unnamed protein product [Heterobilharzia americana]|nr:unnamed protein product [Heterobilharzia americana]